MGLPARSIERNQTSKYTRLRLVASCRSRSRARSRTGASSDHATARHNCLLFVSLVAVFAVLGMGRVWLSVQATAASLEATRLRESIKYERYKGDMLEVRQSALGSPDRIRTIAGAAMNMAPAGKVTYLDLSDGERACATPAASRVSAAGEDLGDVVSQVLNLTAGEAQVLLVGDVGLAATR